MAGGFAVITRRRLGLLGWRRKRKAQAVAQSAIRLRHHIADADVDARGLQRAIGRFLGTDDRHMSAGFEFVLGAGNIPANCCVRADDNLLLAALIAAV